MASFGRSTNYTVVDDDVGPGQAVPTTLWNAGRSQCQVSPVMLVVDAWRHKKRTNNQLKAGREPVVGAA